MKDLAKSGPLGFEVIGLLKLVSGAFAVVVGIGAVHSLGHDPGLRVERIITHLGLNPHNYPINAALSGLTGLDPAHLRAIEAGTFFYALPHTIEGIGLILDRPRAGYLVIVATGWLIPFELDEIARSPAPLRASLFLLNVGIVIYLVVASRKEQQARGREPA
jgi:uncharacterized membrane protein (DUF2068 family)